MNCKPSQVALIVVPKRLRRNGLEQLEGRVVSTVRLLTGQTEPVWVVTPEQWVTITQPCHDAHGVKYAPGERVVAEGIPDAMLRPFDPESAPTEEVIDESLMIPGMGLA